MSEEQRRLVTPRQIVVEQISSPVCSLKTDPGLQMRAEHRRRTHSRFIIDAEVLSEGKRGSAASRRSTPADERCLQEAFSSHQQWRQHKSHLPKSPAAARSRRGGTPGGVPDDREHSENVMPIQGWDRKRGSTQS